uniref:C6 domain-containing protein n=1 Tax=Strongyloides stercoralis TaxID=6248 RepID=A0A0K0EJ43_STRER
MFYIHFLLLIILTVTHILGCLKTIKSQYPKDLNGCCPHVDEYNLPIADPPLHSTSYGWSNSSGLKYYEEIVCPTSAIYECNLNKNRPGKRVVIQFLQENNTIIYEDTDEEHTTTLVVCINGEWILNNKTFSSVTCTQN